ncbi:hypothetical protein [Brevibacillus sp. SAFN-007a]|uniref:hypothetical protein n=1 Tax=Brevibacillus sp. SAFN-007a TaxID=3436862 RepID=UPI003F819903
MELRRFDLLFYKGDSWIGKIIMGVTDSPYSHVAIVLDDLHLVETDWRYPFQIRHLEYRPDEYDVFRLKETLSNLQKHRMQQFINEHLRTPYDLKQSLSNGLFILSQGRIHVMDAANKMNCCESAYKMYQTAWIELLPERPKDYLTPGLLASSEKLIQVA